MALVLLHPDRGLRLQTTERLLKREQWAQWLAAGQLLAEVQQRVDEIDAHLLQRSREAHAAGFEAGRVEGRRQGLVDLLRSLRDEARFVESLNERIAGLVLEVARGLLVEVDDPDWFARRVSALLRKACDLKATRLRVAPARVDAAREVLEAVPAAGGSRWLQIEGDPTLGDSDVVLETQSAIFDGRLHEQLNSVTELLIDVLRAPGPEEREAPVAQAVDGHEER